MGRHRSTLRDLGWGAANSPNPWKHGSAKRVVRALDYGNIEVEPPKLAAEEVVAPEEPSCDQQIREETIGRPNFDRIREQFEAEEAENKRKLERLNGRIAELSDGKRAFWSMLSMQQTKQKTTDRAEGAPAHGPYAMGSDDPEAALRAREDAIVRAESSLAEAKAAHAEAIAAREVLLDQREAAVIQAEERIAAKEAAVAKMMTSVTREEAELRAAKQALSEREALLAAREANLVNAEAALEKDRSSLKAQEAKLSATESVLKDKQQQLAAAAAAACAAAGSVVLPAEVAGGMGEASVKSTTKLNQQGSKATANETANGTDSKSRPKIVMPWSASKPPKPSNKNTAAADKDLAVDRTADWARADNLAKSLVSQSADPDDVFCPLAEQQTCKLSEIFSAPRHREREPGSADWTPLSVLAGATPAGQAGTKIQLVGIDGEYSGETVLLPLESGSSSGTFVIGRSSSCNVTLSRDDQISRRHVEVQAREGKLFIRDLGSTYGTKLNGLALGDHVEQVRPGDTVTMGTSSFRLQTLVGSATAA